MWNQCYSTTFLNPGTNRINLVVNKLSKNTMIVINGKVIISLQQ